MAQKLADILKQKFLKKGDNSKNPRLQDKKVLNNKGNNKEIMTHTLSKDGLKIEDNIIPSTAKKTSKINIKKCCEGIIQKLEARNHLLNLTGNDEQRAHAKRVLHEAHGMMSRFAREYEERRLKFIPPNNVANPNNNVNNDNDGDYEDRFKKFEQKVNNMTGNETDVDDNDQDYHHDDLEQQDDNDVEMEFGANGADDMKDISSELTIGDVINNVIDAIKSDPNISVTDAFKQALDQNKLSDDDVDYYDDDKQPVDDDVDYENSNSYNDQDDDNVDDFGNDDDQDQDYNDQLANDEHVPSAGNVEDDSRMNSIKNNPLNKNPTQVAQRTDGSLMGYRRMS